ncbi:MAG: Fic family protein [Cyanobacteria bacterium P01_H01_bin.105]
MTPEILEQHPWARFEPNLQKVPHTLWMRLGQARAQCEQIACVPLHPKVAQQLSRIYLAKGVLATTAIEGNTLTEAEALAFLNNELKLPQSKEYLMVEINNIVRACNKIAKKGLNDSISIDTLRVYNSWVLSDLPCEEHVIPGEIRKFSVTVGRYKPPNSEFCLRLLDAFCAWLKRLREHSEEQSDYGIEYTIIRAVLAHLYFVLIHPFADGNGRTARLLEFRILLGAGIPAPAAHLLSNFYNSTRVEYYKQLDFASKTGECVNFLTYAVEGLVGQLNEQLTFIRAQQTSIIWKDFIYDAFEHAKSETAVRRRTLVLSLSAQLKPISAKKVREISPKLTEMYAGKQNRTVTRDLNELSSMGLIREVEDGYVVNKELVLAFMPMSNNPELVNQVPVFMHQYFDTTF